jgi:hypothetical protein
LGFQVFELTPSRAGSLPQVIAFHCGSEPAREGASKNNTSLIDIFLNKNETGFRGQ